MVAQRCRRTIPFQIHFSVPGKPLHDIHLSPDKTAKSRSVDPSVSRCLQPGESKRSITGTNNVLLEDHKLQKLKPKLEDEYYMMKEIIISTVWITTKPYRVGLKTSAYFASVGVHSLAPNDSPEYILSVGALFSWTLFKMLLTAIHHEPSLWWSKTLRKVLRRNKLCFYLTGNVFK